MINLQSKGLAFLSWSVQSCHRSGPYKYGTPIIAVCLLAAFFFVGCATHNLPTKPTIQFLHEPESSRKLILFIHGFTGDALQTWTNQESGHSWMDLMSGDANLLDFTVATAGYDTPLTEHSSTIEEAGVRLLRQIQDEGVFNRFEEIYFVAHSMGGLLAKRVLVELDRTTELDKLRKVKAVLFIATPAQGVDRAQWGALLSSNPQIADMQRADFNSYLQSLENRWERLFRDRGSDIFPKSFCAYETKPYPNRLGGVVVSRVSAHTYCDDAMYAIDENHIDIVKPFSTESVVYRWAQARILETSFSARPTSLNSISIELAPRVLHYVFRPTTIRQHEYGFGVVMRVRNNGKKIERVRALEITGDIAADFTDFLASSASGQNMNDLYNEYKGREVYRRISLVYFPINLNKIDPESEEFIKFEALDPTNLTTMLTVGDVEMGKYFGFKGTNPSPPTFLTTAPNIYSFITFTRVADKSEARKFGGPKLREEIRSGGLRFTLKFESGSYIVAPRKILNPFMISWESWQKQTPQDIYFRNNFWNRSDAMQKDPLMEELP